MRASLLSPVLPLMLLLMCPPCVLLTDLCAQDVEQQQRIIRECFQAVSKRPDHVCNFLETNEYVLSLRTAQKRRHCRTSEHMRLIALCLGLASLCCVQCVRLAFCACV